MYIFVKSNMITIVAPPGVLCAQRLRNQYYYVYTLHEVELKVEFVWQ